MARNQVNPDDSGRALELLGLVDGVVSSLSSDIEKFYIKQKEVDSAGFIMIVLVILCYIGITFVVLGIANNFDSFFKKVGSSNFVTGSGIEITILVFLSIVIVVSQYIRRSRAIGIIDHIKRQMTYQIVFCDEFVVRVTDWESNFRSDTFYKPVLRLKISLLIQIVEEARLISEKGRIGVLGIFRSFFPR